MNYIKINTLWSLENIDDRFVFCIDDSQIYNLHNKLVPIPEQHC